MGERDDMSDHEILQVLREHSAAELAEHFLIEKERVYRFFIKSPSLVAKVLGLMLLYRKEWTNAEIGREIDGDSGNILRTLHLLEREGFVERVKPRRWKIIQDFL